jgi:hypothetical protein
VRPTTIPMGVITMPHIQGTTITNIPTITGIMGDMATVIPRPLDLTMVTAGAIMAVILLMDGIMVAVIQLMVGIMGVVMVVIEAVTAGAIMVAVLAEVGGMAAGLEAVFTVDIDKSAIFLSRISGYICDNSVRHGSRWHYTSGFLGAKCVSNYYRL